MNGAFRCVVFCEAENDLLVASRLFAREIASIEHVEGEPFSFGGLDDSETYSGWTQCKRRADTEGVPRLLGHNDLGPDGATAWRALKLAETRKPDCVLLVRDCDDEALTAKQSQLMAGVRRFSAVNASLRVVLATPARMLETWLIAALNCTEALRKELGFDPCSEPHRLTASGTSTSKLNPKTVLKSLASPAEAMETMEGMSIETLRERAARCGLPEFLCSVRCEAGQLVSNDSRLCDCRGE